MHSLCYPYVCTECNRAFKLNCNLKKHLKIHKGERPFTCNICNHNFREKYLLRDHMKKHSNEKPLICEICNKRFRYKRNLLTHIKYHTEERPLPFICQLCPKKFARKCHLVRHLLRFHPEQQSNPEGSNEQLNERSFHDSWVEGHVNNSPNEGLEVQGMQDLGEGPSFEGIAPHRTEYLKEGRFCEGTDAHCMIEPGGESSLQGTNNRRMEDPGEGPSYCVSTNFQRTDNIESPSEEMNNWGMEHSRESSSSWLENEIHRIENYDEGPSYEDILGMDIRPSCEGTKINRMEDTPERPLPGRTSIDQLQNTLPPTSSPRKELLSWEGISILEMEYPGENVSLVKTGPREIQDPGEGPSSRGIIRTNIGGEAYLHRSVNPPGDMVPKAVDSSAPPTSEGEKSTEKSFPCNSCGKHFLTSGDLKRHMMGHVKSPPLSCNVSQREFKPKSNYHQRCNTCGSPQSCEECGMCLKGEEGILLCEECDENLSGES